jgi:hypothetical protein
MKYIKQIMKKKLVCLFAILFSLLPDIGFARLGDTPQELQDRIGVAKENITSKYASDLPPNTEVYKYTKNGFGVMSFFWNGKCCQEVYANRDYSDNRDYPDLSESEIQGLLKANGLCGAWTEDHTTSDRGWVSGVASVDSNNKAMPILGAFYTKHHIFMCFTVKFEQALAAKGGKNRTSDF